MIHGDDSEVDRHRVDAFASEDELTIQEFLQAAPAAPARPKKPRRSASSLYQRIGHAGGLLWLVNTLYLRVLADPLLMFLLQTLGRPGPTMAALAHADAVGRRYRRAEQV